MTERPLSSEEEDVISLAYFVVSQADRLPDWMVERHAGIYDHYLIECPVQVYGILEIIRNLDKWDFEEGNE